MKLLDSANASQVSSAKRIVAVLDDSGRRLVVCSGIALPEYHTDDDENLARETFRVQLHVPALRVEQATASVGLASIANDETAFVFATDAYRVAIDEHDELCLDVDLAVAGDWSALHRFSYQVVVVLQSVGASISGTVSWDRSLFDPSTPYPDASTLFKVVVSRITQGPTVSYTALTNARLWPVEWTGSFYQVHYEVAGLPMNVPLHVGVALAGPFLSPRRDVVGAASLELTATNPSRQVDFKIVRTSVS